AECFLRRAELLLPLSFPGDVERHAQHAYRLSGSVKERAAACRYPALAARGIDYPVFDLINAAARGIVRAPIGSGEMLAIVGMSGGEQRLIARLRPGRNPHDAPCRLRP